MDDVRMLVVGDIHASDQTPGWRTETYGEDILTKVRECVEIAKSKQATHVLLLGDIFDSKYASKISHKLVQQLSVILSSFGVPVYILVGNHDIASGSLDTLPRQPIGTLGFLPNVTLLTWDKVLLDEGLALYPVPGVPLDEGTWGDHFATGGDEVRRIAVVHQLIVPDIEKVPFAARRSFYAANEVARHTDAHMVLYGDVHSKHGIYKVERPTGDPVVFSNLGSICRLSTDNVDHVPEVMVLTIKGDEKRSVSAERFVLTSVRPASEVYRLEEQVATKEYQADIDDTIKRLKTTKIHKFSIDAVMEEIGKNETVEQPVRDAALELLEAVR